MEGGDLNPILQDIGLAIHPPLLYLGYVGFSVCFSFAVAALLEGRLDAAWARWVRPWTLVAWTFLTGGIAMGSYWAYYELGWGGWWFWDPVENASFMPWLVGTALLHSALVMEKRSALKIWTVLLAILTFSLSLLGTFLVRSGVLTSVHSFATDPGRGLFILAILAIFIGGSLSLFALRVQSLTAGGIFHPISREGALVFNNLFLTTAAATVLIGTLYPLLLEVMTGEKISVGAPFFNMTFGPLMIPLLCAVPFGPLLAWKRGDLYGVAQRLMTAFALALVAAGIVLWTTSAKSLLAACGVGLAAWLIFGSLTDLVQKAGIGKVSATKAWARFKGLPRSVLVQDYTLRFEGLRPLTGPNFTENRGTFTLLDSSARDLGRIEPSKRFFPARQMPTTESGIRTLWFSQVYVALGDEPGDGSVVVRIWWKPQVTLIWYGALVMMLGGLFSLADRRLRVGAPASKRKTASQEAEAAA
jgi:cytochrome c-type biogenesis protein CcmF